MAAVSTNAVFVYGTLKRGDVRSHVWPRQPLSVEPAFVRATLYDLGPFPAIAAGEDLVLGELWQFSAEDIGETIRVLDEVEGVGESLSEKGSAPLKAVGEGQTPFRTGSEAASLYERRVIECETLVGVRQLAHVYFCADPAALRLAPAIATNRDRYCQWTKRNRLTESAAAREPRWP